MDCCSRSIAFSQMAVAYANRGMAILKSEKVQTILISDLHLLIHHSLPMNLLVIFEAYDSFIARSDGILDHLFVSWICYGKWGI